MTTLCEICGAPVRPEEEFGHRSGHYKVWAVKIGPDSAPIHVGRGPRLAVFKDEDYFDMPTLGDRQRLDPCIECRGEDYVCIREGTQAWYMCLGCDTVYAVELVECRDCRMDFEGWPESQK